jgi:hypothetical protein
VLGRGMMAHKYIRYEPDEMNKLFGCKEGEYVSSVDVLFDNIGGDWVMEAEILDNIGIKDVEDLSF